MAAAKPADAKSVIAEAVKVDKKSLEHVTAPNDNPTVTHARVEAAIKKGKKLDHVAGPKEGLTDAQKKAFQEDAAAKKAAGAKK